MERQKRGRQDPELDHLCERLLKSLKEFLFQARNRLQFSEFLNDGRKRQILDDLKWKHEMELQTIENEFLKGCPDRNEQEQIKNTVIMARESLESEHKRLMIDWKIDLNLKELSEKILEQFPTGDIGSRAFSQWGERGYFWYLADYESQGFAFKFTCRHFIKRSGDTFDLLWAAERSLDLNFRHGVNAVQIFDIGAGPGCAAAGVIKFLWQQNVKLHRVVFLDPVRVWEKAAEAYRQLGIQFKFVTGENGNAENRYDTLQLLKSHIDDTPDAVVSIICLSHVLVDFLLPDYSDQWWRCLRDACGGRRPLILGFDRNPCRLPQGLQHGQFATLDYVENEELSSAKSFAFFLESVPQRGDRE